MDKDDMRRRYLSNPHLKIDDKLAEQLDIDTQEVAAEVDEPEFKVNQQVVVRRNRGRTQDNSSNKGLLRE